MLHASIQTRSVLHVLLVSWLYALCGLAAAPAPAVEQELTNRGERRCHENPPGLRTPDMVTSGYVVHYLANGDKEFVRLQFVFPERLYYRYHRSTWRAIYIAHPSAVIQQNPPERDFICGYVAGFPLAAPSGGVTDWVPMQDVQFIETPFE